MNVYQPYTYLLKFIPTGQVYYGVSYANSRYRIAHPSHLWDTYFSSSKLIKNLVREHGSNSFTYQIRKTFNTKQQALEWERRVLTRFNVKDDPRWINKSNGGKGFWITEESRKKLSQSKKGQPSSKKGIPMTQEQKAKISASRLTRGITHTDEWKQQQSERFSGPNNPNYGKHHSPETKAKQSAAATGRPSPRKGKQLTDEQKAKQSATMKELHARKRAQSNE